MGTTGILGEDDRVELRTGDFPKILVESPPRELVTMTRAIPVWIALAVTLAACAPKSPVHVETVQDAEAASMTKCTLLKEISVAKSWSDRMLGHVFAAFDQKALDDARLDVRRQAKGIGATHLVWVGGADAPRVSARAYRCR